MSKVAIVGLGYVGLPVALVAEKKGHSVTGIEIDKAKLTALKKKELVVDDSLVEKLLPKSKINLTSDYKSVKDADIVIICVPTPVDDNKNPNLTILKSAVVSSVKHMRNDSLLIIESTINPGVCDEVVVPIIENETNHIVGKTLHLAHCPERINPGDSRWDVTNISRVVGASTPKGLDLAYSFYTKLIDAQVKKMGTIKEAEAVKIVENSFRDVNIAFVNELAMSFSQLGINVVNVIDGAATKPFAFLPHYPGIGVGGHCIPVDPYYLIEHARDKGFDHKFLSLARSINETMPVYAVNKLEEAYIEKTKQQTLKGARVLVLGLSYKPNVGDDRESPAYTVISALKKRGALVTAFDPHFINKSDYKSLKEALEGKDAAVLVTAHNEFLKLNPARDLSGMKVFLDGRNSLNSQVARFSEANISYVKLSG